MLIKKRLNLNLASKPLRNRRLFFFLLSFMGILLIVLSFLAINLFLKYSWKAKQVKASISNVEKKIRIATRKEEEFTTNIKEATKIYKDRVDFINGIILRKSFSWVNFLGNLERALPDSSYIISLVPKLLSDSRMEVKFKAVSRNLDNLLKLINNLKALKFKNIRVESEKEDERGMLVSEISLSYERNI